ncbi:MAG TPA: ATP-binding protein [Candidatus Cybelea sp.]|nr:ATP-binding protein [Candidatus Cybelea sp.]
MACLQRQLTHLTRVVTLGELSGALAHELNQPLTAILSNAQAGQRLLARGDANLAEIGAILHDIVEDDRRAAAVLARLRRLMRDEPPAFAKLDLNEIAGEVLALVGRDLSEKDIAVTTELGTGLPPVHGDAVQLQQVLLNLIRNASDAMAGSGERPRRLTVATACAGSECRVTVTDTGSGVAEEVQETLFHPFITTKPQGMGLGLAISRSILAAHGGRIWCEADPGGGARFGFALTAQGGGT